MHIEENKYHIIDSLDDLLTLEKDGWTIIANEKFKDGVTRLHLSNDQCGLQFMMAYCKNDILDKYYLTKPHPASPPSP